MTSLWSPVRVLDGTRKAQRNAQHALMDTITQREQERFAVALFEREYAARPDREALTQIRRSAGFG
jgi:hypothetical protein